MKKLLLVLAFITTPALADKQCKDGYSLDSDKECVKTRKESCTTSGYCHGCGYGYKSGKYKYHCGYGHRSNCKGDKKIVEREDGSTKHRGQCNKR